MTNKEIFKALQKAQEMSYSPYSNFRVGAFIKMKNGKEFYGANIENAAYGLCICAERTALFQFKLNKLDPKDIEHFAIIGDTDDYISPCGSCRQVMSELLNKNSEVMLFNKFGDCKIVTVNDLLPFSFSKDDIK